MEVWQQEKSLGLLPGGSVFSLVVMMSDGFSDSDWDSLLLSKPEASRTLLAWCHVASL